MGHGSMSKIQVNKTRARDLGFEAIVKAKICLHHHPLALAKRNRIGLYETKIHQFNAPTAFRLFSIRLC